MQYEQLLVTRNKNLPSPDDFASPQQIEGRKQKQKCKGNTHSKAYDQTEVYATAAIV